MNFFVPLFALVVAATALPASDGGDARPVRKIKEGDDSPKPRDLLKQSPSLRTLVSENGCNQDDIASCEAFELDFDLLSQYDAFNLHGVGEVMLVSLGIFFIIEMQLYVKTISLLIFHQRTVFFDQTTKLELTHRQMDP